MGRKLLNLKILLVGLAFLFIIPVLAACGDSTQTAIPPQPTATLPAATPITDPSPTTAPVASPTPKQPVVVIPPATVTPVNNQGPTSTPAATIPPAPTGPVVTALASTPLGSVSAGTTQSATNATLGGTPQNGTVVVTAGPLPTTQPASTPAASPASAQPTAQPNGQQNDPGIIFYYKDGSLMANVPGEKSSRQLAENIFSYLQAGPGRVVFLQQSGDGTTPTLQLKMISLTNGQVRETLLDAPLFQKLPTDQQNDRPSGLYGVDSRAMGEMAISPDGTQVVYTRANLSGSTFDGMFTKEKPTELWLANLDPANPAPKQLVPNDKDYIARPIWSPDGNRIAFIRTSAFGTGAGFATALWSVYKDGSRLAFLTGPDLGKVDGANFSATPAFNLRWVGPQVLAFQATNQVKSPLFLHDLSLGRDFPVVLASDAAPEAVFCDGIQRYIYQKTDSSGQPQPGIFSVGITNPANQTGTVDKDALDLYDCVGNSLLYLNNKGQVVLALLNPDGTIAGNKTLATGQGPNVQVAAKIAPGGRLAVVQVGKVSKVLADNGQITELKSSSFNYDTLSLEWVSDKVLVGLTYTTGQPGQLLVANLSGEQVFKPLDMGDTILFTGPNEVVKAGF